jgi:hypothetical protein
VGAESFACKSNMRCDLVVCPRLLEEGYESHYQLQDFVRFGIMGSAWCWLPVDEARLELVEASVPQV